MKKIFIAAAALLMTTASLQAQTKKEDPKGTHHKGPHAKRESFAKLNLNDEQKKKAKDINADYHKQFADLKKNTTMSVGDYRTKTAALKKEQHEKMQSLLTTEQKNQLVAQRKEGEKRMKEGQSRNFEKMKSQLGLSEEQSKKIKESQAGFQSKMKSIREDKTLTPDQKKEQVRNIAKQQHEQMKTVLTPEQLQKMKTGRKGRPVSTEK